MRRVLRIPPAALDRARGVAGDGAPDFWVSGISIIPGRGVGTQTSLHVAVAYFRHSPLYAVARPGTLYPMTDISDISASAGATIRERRRLLGLTQAEVAALCDVSRDTMVRVEADDDGVAVGTLRRVAAAVGLELTLQSRYRDS